MALSPSQQFMYGGVFLYLLAVILSISAVAVPRFGQLTAGSQGLEVGYHMGAFQFCVSAFILNLCGSIDSSCKVHLDLPSGSGSGSGSSSGGGSFSDEGMPYCGTFNAFRGFLVTSLVFGGVSLLSALLYACTAKPSPVAAHVTFASALLSAVAAAISLVCWYGFSSAFWSDAIASAAQQGLSADWNSSNGASFYLLVSAMVAVLLGIATWLYGVHQKRLAETGGMAGQPHFHNAPAHYVPDGQLNQPLTQH